MRIYYEPKWRGPLSDDAPGWVVEATRHIQHIQYENVWLIDELDYEPINPALLADLPSSIRSYVFGNCSAILLTAKSGVFATCEYKDERDMGRLGLTYIEFGTGKSRLLQDRQDPKPEDFLVQPESGTVFFTWHDIKASRYYPRPTTVRAYEISSGRPLWEHVVVNHARQSTHAQVVKSSVVVPLYDRLARFDLDRDNPFTPSPVWETTLLDHTVQDWHLIGQTLYVATKLGSLYAIDWETGYIYWVQNLARTLEPGLADLKILRADASTLTVSGYSGELRVFAQLGDDGHRTSPVSSPTPIPTYTRMPNPSALPIPTAESTQHALEASALQPRPAPTLAPSLSWDDLMGETAIKTDLDKDGSDEWLVLAAHFTDRDDIQVNQKSPSPFAHSVLPLREWGISHLDYLLLEQDEAGYWPTAALTFTQTGVSASVGHPSRILASEDVNGDNYPEIILYGQGCSPSTCFTRLTIWQWDGTQFQDLVAGSIKIPFVKFDFVDNNADGVLEILANGGTAGSTGTGFQRPRDFSYEWQDGRYRLTNHTPIEGAPPPNNVALFDVVDAERLLAGGDYDKTIDLARRTVLYPRAGLPQRFAFSTKIELSRTVSYAAIQAMYVHSLRGELDTMRAYLNEIETKYDDPDNPYVKAAHLFLRTFEATGDPWSSCRLLRQNIANLGDFSHILEQYTRTTETVNPENICPEHPVDAVSTKRSRVPPTPSPTATHSPTATSTPLPTSEAHAFDDFLLPTPSPAPTLVATFGWEVTMLDSDEKVGSTNVLADMDNDGQNEWMLSLDHLIEHNDAWESVSDMEARVPDPFMRPVLDEFYPWDYLIFEQDSKGEWEPTAHLPQRSILPLALTGAYQPSILVVDDINQDGNEEIVVFSFGCSGTGSCWGYLTFWQWNGDQFKNLMQSQWRHGISISYPSYDFLDVDQDQRLDISVIGGTSGHGGLDAHRAQHSIYSWLDDEYVLMDQAPVETPYMPFQIIDTQEALHQGDLERALEMVRKSLFSRNKYYKRHGLSDTELLRLTNLAAIQAMIIHAEQGEVGTVDAYFRFVDTCCHHIDNPYVEAARIYWETYRASGDSDTACGVLTEYIRQLGSFARVMSDLRRMERLDPHKICPSPSNE